MEALILVAHRRADDVRRIGVMRALNHGKPDRRSCHKASAPKLQGSPVNGGYATLRFSAEVLPRFAISS
jgi:hypothetical protein